MSFNAKIFVFVVVPIMVCIILGISLEMQTLSMFVGIAIAVIGLIVVNYSEKNKMNKAVAKYDKATDDLKDKCSYSYSVNGIKLTKQDPQIADLIKIKVYQPHIYTQTPMEIVYTSATVGGVTTGGFHTTGGDIVRTDLYSNSFEILYWDQITKGSYKAKPVEKILLSDELKELAKKTETIKDYLDDKGNIVVVDDFKVSEDTALLLRGGYTGHAVNNFNMDKVDSYPGKYKCEKILNFLYGIDC